MDPDVYDTLELAAFAFGGVGCGKWFRYDSIKAEDDLNCPVCAHGLALFAEDIRFGTSFGYSGIQAQSVISTELQRLGISILVNDNAVDAIRERKEVVDDDERVSFAAWTKQLNVVRGDNRQDGTEVH